MSEISSLAMLDVKPLLLSQCQGPKGQGAGAAASPSPGHDCCGLCVSISAAEVASHVAFKVPQPKGCPLLSLQYGHCSNWGQFGAVSSIARIIIQLSLPAGDPQSPVESPGSKAGDSACRQAQRLHKQAHDWSPPGH